VSRASAIISTNEDLEFGDYSSAVAPAAVEGIQCERGNFRGSTSHRLHVAGTAAPGDAAGRDLESGWNSPTYDTGPIKRDALVRRDGFAAAWGLGQLGDLATLLSAAGWPRRG